MQLIKAELATLKVHSTEVNPQNAKWTPMKLYLESEVQGLVQRKQNGETIQLISVTVFESGQVRYAP